MEHASLARNLLPFGVLFRVERYKSNHSALNLTGDFNFKSKFNQDLFTQKLINEQAKDGSWHQLVDLNKKEGSLDATIFNCIVFYLY